MSGSASSQGLSRAAAAERLRREGPNELPAGNTRSFLRIVRDVLREPMFVLLICAGLVYLALGDRLEALVLLIFATASVGIAVAQDLRSERALQALADLASPRALVMRDGARIRIAGRDVVRGDLLIVSEGDRIVADGRLIASHDLMADESLLTGESVPVEKQGGAEGDASLLFAGTLATRGEATAEVIATGSRSRMGEIGLSLQTIESEPSRLQRETRRLVRNFGVFGGIVAVGVVLMGGAILGSWLQAALSGIAVGMSLLPEEFPLVLSVFMVMGARRIARAGVLTRRSPAIEALGTTTVLCTDKTGTLTENRMTVSALWSGAGGWTRDSGNAVPIDLAPLLSMARLASTPNSADPMEQAIARLCTESKISPPAGTIAKRYGLRHDLPAMTNAWDDGKLRLFSKGAPEAIARLCKLSPQESRVALDEAARMAAAGMRVLGLAGGGGESGAFPEDQAQLELRFAGLIAFIDPVRSDVPAAMSECRTAGIRVVMITGDHPVTARAIAEQCGMAGNAVITGSELAALDDTTLAQRLAEVSIFARVQPAQKLRLVEMFKRRGEIVAMTGDGVNDAPALKAAHIGVAMGGRGTDVAREAASIILLNDDFASLVHTIRLGRRIFDNLQKAMLFIVAVHVAIAGLAFLPLLLGLPVLLLPVHIAFLEMVIDPACSLVFEAEPEEAGIMLRPPRPQASTMLSSRDVLRGFLEGAIVLLVALVTCGVAVLRQMPADELRAVAFVTIVLSSLALILVNRTFAAALLAQLGAFNRIYVLLSSLVTAALAAILLVPALRHLFGFGVLHLDDVAIATAAALAAFLLLTAAKRLRLDRILAR